MIDPKDSIFPKLCVDIDSSYYLKGDGMTIELEIASRILAGWLGNFKYTRSKGPEDIHTWALYHARKMIEEANK